MDARVKSRVAAYGDPAAQQSAAGAGAGDVGYSASLGNIGMGDEAGTGTGSGSGNGHDDGKSPAEAFKEVGNRIGELKEFASYYVGAKLDGIKVTVRNVGIYAALGIVGLIAASAIITTSVVLLLGGLAWGIGAIFEKDRPWVGAIVVGLLVLGGLAGGIIFGMKKLTNTFRKQLVQKYENRQRDQRINFGEDVRGRREASSGRAS
jgi:hypothetical protein